MRIVIADDEPLALELLEHSLQQFQELEIVGRAASGDAALALIISEKPDLAILDIAMPKLNGIEVARLAGQSTHPPLHAFLTAYSDFAIKAFEINALDYVLKPFAPERIGETLARARKRLALDRSGAGAGDIKHPPAVNDTGYLAELWVPTRVGLRRLPTSDIVWIEAARDYILLHTELRTEIIRMRMAELEGKLDPAQLLRVHRSYFVRPEAVVELEQIGRSQLQLVLTSGVRIDVGRTYADRVRIALTVEGMRQLRTDRFAG